jgi:F0F1-type ATP synthase gamma subunit
VGDGGPQGRATRSLAHAPADYRGISQILTKPACSSLVPVVQLGDRSIRFCLGEVDEVFVAYTDFVDALTQRPRVLRLLPLSPYENGRSGRFSSTLRKRRRCTPGGLQYEFEPPRQKPSSTKSCRASRSSPSIRRFWRGEASERSARMVADAQCFRQC